ncbi:MAG: hypothetical protein EOP49_15860, partial [Sphingobacteriales bacterium]
GLYIKQDNVELGSVLPKFKGGWLNTFSYKNVTLRVNTDFVVGGKFFSTTKMFNAYSGLAAETAGLNEQGKPLRDDPSTGGGVLLDGVTEDGKQNTTRVDTQNLYENWLFALNERWIYDKTYIKLREVAFGYNLPKHILGKTLKSVNVSLIARNPLLIYSAVGGGIDISESGTFRKTHKENGVLHQPSAQALADWLSSPKRLGRPKVYEQIKHGEKWRKIDFITKNGIIYFAHSNRGGDGPGHIDVIYRGKIGSGFYENRLICFWEYIDGKYISN